MLYFYQQLIWQGAEKNHYSSYTSLASSTLKLNNYKDNLKHFNTYYGLYAITLCCVNKCKNQSLCYLCKYLL